MKQRYAVALGVALLLAVGTRSVLRPNQRDFPCQPMPALCALYSIWDVLYWVYDCELPVCTDGYQS